MEPREKERDRDGRVRVVGREERLKVFPKEEARRGEK